MGKSPKRNLVFIAQTKKQFVLTSAEDTSTLKSLRSNRNSAQSFFPAIVLKSFKSVDRSKTLGGPQFLLHSRKKYLTS